VPKVFAPSQVVQDFSHQRDHCIITLAKKTKVAVTNSFQKKLDLQIQKIVLLLTAKDTSFFATSMLMNGLSGEYCGQTTQPHQNIDL